MEYCTYKSQSENSVFQHFENFYFEKFSLGPTRLGLIVEAGYERISNIISVSSAYKISKMAL